MSLRLVHVITPGDHYSPRTGSAIATVVHGLSSATPPGEPRPAVAVGRSTYPDRYDDADALEYDEAPPLGPRERRADAVRARLGLPRTGTRGTYAAALAGQGAWEPSVVLVHNGPQGVALVDAARHVPVLYAHNQLLRTYSQREAGRALENAAAVVCVSDDLAQATADRLPPSLRGRVRVVRNGVDTATLRPGPPRTPGAPLEVSFVGRMIPDKGADVLLRAALLLDRPDVHVTVVGSSGFSATDPLTPFETEVRALAAGLGERVTLSPFVPRAQVAALLAAADVVVVPSRWPDPCPLTVLEGMAAGAVVIGSAIGGIPELLGDAGVPVRPDDPEALAAAIARLADDPDALAAAQAQARAHAVARDWTVVRRDLSQALGPALAPAGHGGLAG